MTTTDRGAKRRARRIAADEAHAWARNLRLNNPFAKLTLCMLTLYVDGDGYCFVGIPTLAEDTELSPATVRSRLAFLEAVGAISRRRQWIDEYGRRNGDHRGKCTSDLIRLMIDVAEERIEAVAEEIVSREVSPSPQAGLNPARDSVDPALALRQPFDSAKGLISEPEPEPEQIAAAAVGSARLVDIDRASKLAEQLLIIAGHDPNFWPPGWCGAPMRVQAWLAAGWPPQAIVAATRAVVARGGAAAASVQFFEKAIAEEIARLNRPIPEISHVQTNRPAQPARGGGYARLAARLAHFAGKSIDG